MRYFKLTHLIVTATVMLCAEGIALAHDGARIWINNHNGAITTYRSDNDLSPTYYVPCRLFRTEFENFGGIYTTEFPGFEVVRDGAAVAGGTTFRFDIAGPSLYFDEVAGAFVTTTEAFGPPEPGPVPQIALSLSASVRVTSDGPVGGFDFFTYFATGDHSHLSFTLFGDGESASDGPAGIYAVPLTLSAPSLGTSDTFYLLIGKGVADEDPMFDTAYDIARSTLIGVGVPGDMDCDGSVGLPDLPAFVDAVMAATDGNVNLAGCCNLITADMNTDGRIDGEDIQQFVTELIGA